MAVGNRPVDIGIGDFRIHFNDPIVIFERLLVTPKGIEGVRPSQVAIRMGGIN